MKKKHVATIALLIVVALAGLFSYRFLAGRQNSQEGQKKFSKALSELRTENPSVDNPCLGTSVLRSYSYKELNSKTIEESKSLRKKILVLASPKFSCDNVYAGLPSISIIKTSHLPKSLFC